MVGNFVIAAASAAVIALSPAAFAQETGGTARRSQGDAHEGNRRGESG